MKQTVLGVRTAANGWIELVDCGNNQAVAGFTGKQEAVSYLQDLIKIIMESK